jgi:hypothetical protein
VALVIELDTLSKATHVAFLTTCDHIFSVHRLLLALSSTMAKLTADNRGPGLNIGMWIIMVPTVLMVASKIATKWFTMKKIGADDILLGIALVSIMLLLHIAEGLYALSMLDWTFSS